MKLTAEVVTKFAQIKAQRKALEEEEDTLARDLKDEMIARGIDEFAPANSPYKLLKVEYDKTAVSWKEVAENAFKELYGKTWKVKLEREATSYGKKHEVRLDCPINEHYRKEVVA